MDLIKLLEQTLVKHSRLKIEDRKVVKEILDHIRISEKEELINEHIRTQVQAEAGIVYLSYRYQNILRRLDRNNEEYRAGVSYTIGSVDDEGHKWTKQGKEETLIATDAKYLGRLERIDEMQSLCNLLRGLSTIVFNRDRKLEQLSVNYRVEAKADRHA